MLLQLDVIRVWLGQNTKKERGSIERGERDCINVNSTHSWTMPPPQWDNFLSKLQSKLPKHFSNNINSTPPRGIFLSLWFLPTHPFFYSVVQSALSISSTLTFNHKFEGCWTEGVFHFGNNKRPSKLLSTKNNSASKVLRQKYWAGPWIPYTEYRKAVNLSQQIFYILYQLL